MPEQKRVADTSVGNDETAEEAKARKRTVYSFPPMAFDTALGLAQAIQKVAAGQKVRRLTLFDQIGKSPSSSASRDLITNASKYGLIKGSYKSEHLELTADGQKLTSPSISDRERAEIRFDLAISRIKPFNELYEHLKNNRLPSHRILEDVLQERGYSVEQVPECIETFIVNAKSVGILQTLSGAETIVPIEHVLEELTTTPSSNGRSGVTFTPVDSSVDRVHLSPVTVSSLDPAWDRICFYITPIGEDGSENRKHSDLFLHSIVEPALERFDFRVVRADKIGKPGMITAQIIEHILKSRLVIADLSFHNPNVFYELALRHASRLPTVQIIRKADRIPFDLDQFRTIQIDTTDIYTLVPQLEVYRTEIANQVRSVLEGTDAVDNPVTAFYPSLRMNF